MKRYVMSIEVEFQHYAHRIEEIMEEEAECDGAVDMQRVMNRVLEEFDVAEFKDEIFKANTEFKLRVEEEK
jgi:hypothetical protein